MLDELKASMKEKGLTLAYDEELVKHLVKKSMTMTVFSKFTFRPWASVI